MNYIEMIPIIAKKSKISNNLTFFLLCLLSFPLSAKEISILPAAISGEIPAYLGTKYDASIEIAKLTRHYLKKNFFTEITDPKLVSVFLENENFNYDANIKEETLNVFCTEWDSHFITKDSVDFGNPVLIQTDIYNCKNKTLQTIKSKIVSNFLITLEKHIDKSFRFLPPKPVNTRNFENVYHEITFLVDTNAAYSYYRKDFIQTLQSLIDIPNLFLGLTLIRKNQTVSIPATLDHGEFKKTIEEISWSGANSSDSILQTIQVLKLKINSGRKTSRKLFLLLSGSATSKSNAIILALNELRQIGIELYIIIPNHSELSVIRELQRIARSSSATTLGITEYQRIGTEEDYSQIFLNQFNVYYTNVEVSLPFQLEGPPFKKWDASLVREAVGTVTPYNLYQVYEKLKEKRILEKTEIKTNIESLIGNEITKNDDHSERHQTVLLESGKESIWLKVPKELNLQVGKEYLFQTTIFSDPISSWGIKNIPAETSISKVNSSYPSSLLIMPSQAKKFIETNKIHQFTGYMKGVVSVIKKK